MDLTDPLVRRQVLEQGPVGDWRSVAGTRPMPGHDRISFYPDGTGELRLWSPVLGEAHECLPFHWRLLSAGVLGCRYVQQEYATDPDEDDEPARAADGDPWLRVAFMLEQRATDVGTFWLLREADRDGFWTLLDPVMPEGAAPAG
jgi:hypothetical protein